MPKACFLLDHFWGERSGGAEWQTFVLCRALREAGWEVHYIAESLMGKRETTVEAQGIQVHWLPALHSRNRLHPTQSGVYRTVHGILDRMRPDVLYTRGNNRFTGIGVCHRYRREQGTRYVWGAAADWEVSRDFYRQKLGYYQKAIWKKSLLWLDACLKDRDHAGEIAMADCVIAQTESQRQLISARFHKEAIVLPSSHEVPADLPPKTTPPVVIFVAHIGRRKRVELFVDLARQCQDQNISFVVVGEFGDASYEREVRERASGLASVRFLGRLGSAETNDWIARARLLVSTTDPEREGYPNVFVQAWLRKTPVISLAFDPDQVISRHVFLGSVSGSVDGMVRTVKELSSDCGRVERMGQSARVWSVQKHSYETNRGQIRAVFDRFANGERV